MGYIPPPPRVLPKNSTDEDRKKLYWEYRAELVAARDYNSRMAGSGLVFLAVAAGFTVILLVILRII